MPTALIGAGISAAGSVASGSSSKKGANAAAKAQAQAYANALAEQQREFGVAQQAITPYVNAGQQALGGQQTLLGLNGNEAQQSAITSLQNSPAFTSLYNQGTDAILQNAAATGGLRGGNIENGQLSNSLPGFSSSLLATVIQNQLSGLSGLSGMGQSAAGTLGSLGQNSANAQSQLMTQAGQTQAGYGLANSLYGNNTVNGLSGTLQKLVGGTNLTGVSAGAVQRLAPAAQNLIANNSALF
jgi:hypothetical protein